MGVIPVPDWCLAVKVALMQYLSSVGAVLVQLGCSIAAYPYMDIAANWDRQPMCSVGAILVRYWCKTVAAPKYRWHLCMVSVQYHRCSIQDKRSSAALVQCWRNVSVMLAQEDCLEVHAALVQCWSGRGAVMPPCLMLDWR
jgi:hypothetical protein